jgi:hypothetical protein
VTLKLIENLAGIGICCGKKDGDSHRVRYEIRVLQGRISTSRGEGVAGTNRIEGRVFHISDSYFAIRSVGQYFVLTLKDGRKLDFFFKDQYGTIANTGAGLY